MKAYEASAISPIWPSTDVATCESPPADLLSASGTMTVGAADSSAPSAGEAAAAATELAAARGRRVALGFGGMVCQVVEVFEIRVSGSGALNVVQLEILLEYLIDNGPSSAGTNC